MDVGYYISELLGQHGDVNVPGLGYFAHSRVNGYYNDREGKFYPPGYSVQFDPQFLDDDDVLAIHIAEKKKISVASSKYFTEKFVLTLKQQAAIGETALADLGWFTMYNLQLIFRPNAVTSTDPEFFGYPTIRLHKKGKQPVIEQHESAEPAYNPGTEEPQYNPQPYIPGEQYKADGGQEEYLIELTRKKRRKTTWVFILLTLIATAVAVFMVKKYDPETFKFSFGSKEKHPEKAPIILETIDTGKTKADTDSVHIVRSLNPDSVKNTLAAVKDTTSVPRYEVIAGAFKDLAEAGNAIRNFKTIGIDAKIVPEMPGRRIKVSVGTFITEEPAEKLKQHLIAVKKIAADSYVQPIKPKEKDAKTVKK